MMKDDDDDNGTFVWYVYDSDMKDDRRLGVNGVKLIQTSKIMIKK